MSRCDRYAASPLRLRSADMLKFPSPRAVLLLTGVTDHGQMCDRHMTVFGAMFIYAVLFHLFFRVFLHTMHFGI